MELTPAESRLITTLREIDRVNPAGVDGFSGRSYLDMFQSLVDGAAAEAARRYQLFLTQSKGNLIDLQEAQRLKRPHEDTRARAEERERYESSYKLWGLPAPIWTTGSPAPGAEADITPEPEPEHEMSIAEEWANPETGTMFHAVKHLKAPAAAIAAALRVTEAIKQTCDNDAAAEGIRTEFTNEAIELLTALRLRVEEDNQANCNGA